MAELAYAADLKSAAFGLVGSSPTAPTSSLLMQVLTPAGLIEDVLSFDMRMMYYDLLMESV